MRGISHLQRLPFLVILLAFLFKGICRDSFLQGQWVPGSVLNIIHFKEDFPEYLFWLGALSSQDLCYL